MAAFVVLAAAGAGLAGPGSTRVSHFVDKGLCPFPLDITVATADQGNQAETTVLRFSFAGRNSIKLRNGTTGRTVVLSDSGPYAVDTRTGSVAFTGHQVWFWSAGNQVPFLSTDGSGRFVSPNFTLSGSGPRSSVIDPCALVAPAPPSTRPARTQAPWGLPSNALSRIAYAGLTPLLGTLIRHDHSHLDVIVNGKNVAVPAGVGLAEPVDNGPCPPSPLPQGDCATKHIYTAQVANSPLHTHSTSGIIHIEPDRPGTLTLGQFFDEWGVRLDSTCVGGYCTGGGKELRLYVNGKRVAGNPRRLVLTNEQEIAVVYGGPDDFRSVPAGYASGWPGVGCGGPGEHAC